MGQQVTEPEPGEEKKHPGSPPGTRSLFPPVPSVPDFVSLETEAIERWKRDAIFERSLELRNGAQEFVFYEGPPTANGKPGLHHVWARVYKDLFCRFQTMRGKYVLRKAGWDTHGLPVEVEVEKRLGLTGKKQIEEYGIEKFTRLCRESVYAYVEDWKVLTERIGFWVNTDDAYWTLTPDYIESVWWLLKQMWDKGLLYEDEKGVPYCPRCGTALSSHELGQPDVYRDVEDPSVYVRFPLVDSDVAASFLVWTTTPWTLFSNVGVAVNPEIVYAVVDGTILAVDRVTAVFGDSAQIERYIPGTGLIGIHYQRPYDTVAIPAGFDACRVVPADYVTTEEGTGLVHLAPAFGEIDRLVGRENGLPGLNPIGPDGRFNENAGWLSGVTVSEASEKIIDDLRERGLLFKDEMHLHSYPHCWRCGTALIYWGKRSWYVATSSRKQELLDENEKIGWRPEHIKHGRFGEWLENNVDWALSRDRYWGTPLPIWRCDQNHAVCVGSFD